jgi:CheY-like chemotaxis protein
VAVTSSRDLVKQATRSPDVELILLSDALNDETTWSTLESLHAGPKTARVPVGILSRPHRLDDMQQIADDHGRVLVIADTVDKELLAPQVARLRELAGRDLIPVSRRIDQATLAQEWLSREPVATQFKDHGLTIWQK